jgi:TonB family protein
MLRHIAAPLVLVCLLCASSIAEKPEDRARAEAIVNKASANFGRPYDTPYVVSYTITTPISAAHSGSYRLVADDHRWREDFELGDFKEVLISTSDKVYTSRSVPFEILPSYDMHLMLSPLLMRLKPATLLPKELRVKSIKSKRIFDQQATCFEAMSLDFGVDECFDPATGDLLTYRASTERVEYHDYAPFGNARLPRDVKFYDSETLVAQATLAQVAKANLAPDAFNAPTGATETPTCSGRTLPHIRSKLPPTYPPAARNQRIQGTVAIYARIKEDGSLSDLHVVEDAGQLLDESAVRAVSQWKYEPAHCGNKGVPTETVITVHYTLQ